MFLCLPGNPNAGSSPSMSTTDKMLIIRSQHSSCAEMRVSIFHSFEAGIALAIPASNEWKIFTKKDIAGIDLFESYI